MILLILIVGAIIGWLGAKLTGRSEGILGSLAIGIIGAIIGDWIGMLLGSSNTSFLSFTLVGFIWSLIGAVIFSAILNIFTRRRSTHV